MLRWTSNRLRCSLFKGRGVTLHLRCAPNFVRHYATAGDSVHRKEAPLAKKYKVFGRIEPPEQEELKNPEAWVGLIEAFLPPHLRRDGRPFLDVKLSIVDVAEILLAAQKNAISSNGADILYHLGIEEDRWDAVIWLVQQLVENLQGTLEATKLSQTVWPWENKVSLKELTAQAFSIEQSNNEEHRVRNTPTLDDLTTRLKPEAYESENRMRQDTLGQVWRSLGAMIIACSEHGVKPEILEIIAYLHHQEIMPSSIYNHKPRADPTVIQQPPTLHLLSSRILTSLSDAAWRAHEKLIVEEAKAKGGHYQSLRPEIPGTAYRVHVAGLRPEIWLELILWSCLHGGWIVEGSAILTAIYRQPEKLLWKPLSWRSLMPVGYEQFSDWDKLASLYNTTVTAKNQRSELDVDVKRTVSSEVVNAYTDVLLSKLEVGVGHRGVSPNLVLYQLNVFRALLERSNLKLGGGSWEAVIMRFVDLQPKASAQLGYFFRLLDLAPGFGREVKASNTSHLPTYVFDGTAAILGLSHRALNQQIENGSVQKALQVLRRLRDFTDRNKRESIHDFFESQRESAQNESTAGDEIFTNNYSRITYPAFELWLPSTILGPLLHLLLDAKEYDIARWLIFGEDIDGPIIKLNMYHNPAMTPALIRYAAETKDGNLMNQLSNSQVRKSKDPRLSTPNRVIRAYLDTQISYRSWPAATRLMEYIRDEDRLTWSAANLATLARVMLLQYSGALSGDEKCEADLLEAQNLFQQIIGGTYDNTGGRDQVLHEGCTTVVLMLASLDPYWANFVRKTHKLEKKHHCSETTSLFNTVLEGVVAAYGSATGRRLLSFFWSHDVRNAQFFERSKLRQRSRPSILERLNRQRGFVLIPGGNGEKVAIYGGIDTNLRTIGIIFRQALHEMELERRDEPVSPRDVPIQTDFPQEMNEDSHIFEDSKVDVSPSGMVVWCVKRLSQLGMRHDHILEQLQSSLSGEELEHIISQGNLIVRSESAESESEDQEEWSDKPFV